MFSRRAFWSIIRFLSQIFLSWCHVLRKSLFIWGFPPSERRSSGSVYIRTNENASGSGNTRAVRIPSRYTPMTAGGRWLFANARRAFRVRAGRGNSSVPNFGNPFTRCTFGSTARQACGHMIRNLSLQFPFFLQFLFHSSDNHFGQPVGIERLPKIPLVNHSV